MPIGSLRVYLIDARIAFDGNDARTAISQPKPRLDIVRVRGGVEVEAEPSRLELDQSQCEAEEGHRTIAALTADFAQAGREDAVEAAVQTNAQGRALMENMPSEQVVRARIAWMKAFPQPSTPGLAFVPSQPPHMEFTPYVYRYRVTPDTLEFHWQVHPTAEVGVVRQADLHVRMVRYPQVEIEYLPPVLDEKA